MLDLYDNRIDSASANTAFGLDTRKNPVHSSGVKSSAEIIDELRSRGIKQSEIAEVLHIKQPNVATLFTQGKNGKPRALKYDEGVKLIAAFKLEGGGEDPTPWLPRSETIALLLEGVLRALSVAPAPKADLQAAADYFVAALLQLAEYPEWEDTPGALDVLVKQIADATGPASRGKPSQENHK